MEMVEGGTAEVASVLGEKLPEEIDRLVEGLHKVKKTLGNGASPTRGPSEGGVRE